MSILKGNIKNNIHPLPTCLPVWKIRHLNEKLTRRWPWSFFRISSCKQSSNQTGGSSFRCSECHARPVSVYGGISPPPIHLGPSGYARFYQMPDLVIPDVLRNLYILNSKLLLPTRLCLKNTGPGEIILMSRAATVNVKQVVAFFITFFVVFPPNVPVQHDPG